LKKLEKINKIDSEEGIYIMNSIAGLKVIQRKFNEALEKYNESLNMVKRAKLNNTHAHLTILKSMSNIYGTLRNHNKSMSCIQLALSIETNLKGKGHVEKITSHSLMGAVHQQMGNYDLAI
jgi:tetratricopeptide (TPR) repeat protein